LVERESCSADCEGRPAEREEPHLEIFQGSDDLAKVEVALGFSRSVLRKAGLDECFLFFREPFCCGWDWFLLVSLLTPENHHDLQSGRVKYKITPNTMVMRPSTRNNLHCRLATGSRF
jgi:hypothetical protein